MNTTLTFIFIINSIFLIGLILNQNESSKDSVTSQNTSSSSNPLESLTWFSICFEFLLLLIRVKLFDF